VVLEPVNADYQPVAPGRTSHTVLLSNLANRVQPILRYDLGDSIVAKPDACPCGNPLPAIRVEGRTGEPLVFPSPGGNVALMPLALGGVLDRVAGVSRFQIVQSAPAALRVRLEVAAGAESDRVWQESQAAISGLLAESGLEHVSVERAAEPPRRSGSKYRKIIPLDGG
jgi:phenylacetate-coenzyme A ligase PaaK-like adenylate-forming protein